MEIITTRIIETLVTPPSGPLLLVALATLLLWRGRRSGVALIALAWVTLYFSSIPFTRFAIGDAFARLTPPIEEPAKLIEEGVQAIVVLGGGRYHAAPEYGGDDRSNPLEVERLRYAAYLHRQTGLPLAVIGGDPFNTGQPESDLMRQLLEQELLVPVIWADGRSRNTGDNARYARELLAPLSIDHVALVSHASHLPRARSLFESAGFRVTAAPTGFQTRSPLDRGWLLWVPTAQALATNNRYLHELAGMAVGHWFMR